jgi:hypothetical protein
MANRNQATEPRPAGKQSPAGAATRNTGGARAASDHLYGVESVLYHALQGVQTYEQYRVDARKAKAPAVEQFFDACQKEENMRAQRAKALLFDLLEDEEDDADEDAGSDASEQDDEEEEEQ